MSDAEQRRSVDDLSDDEIVDAIAVRFGQRGFDDEKHEHMLLLGMDLGLGDLFRQHISKMEALQNRLDSIRCDLERLDGSYGITLSPAEWANRIVLMLAMKHGYEFARGEQEEIAAMLAGKAGKQ